MLKNDELYFLHRIAYDTLVENGCSDLPTDIESILKFNAKVDFNTYDEAVEYFGVSLQVIKDSYGDKGFIGYAPISKIYNIILNTDVDKSTFLSNVALSISFIRLGLADKYNGQYLKLHDKEDYVYEYSRCLLAPNIILKECGISSNKDIMEYTLLSFSDSLYKEQQLKNNRGFQFMLGQYSAIEKMMIRNYNDFITRFKSKNNT